MRYKIAEIEDQILATLEADTANFSGVQVETFAGELNEQMFLDPEYMQGVIRLLPFTFVSYKGRTSKARDSSGRTWIHTLRFSIFTGAKSFRQTQEASRNCYDMLSATFDALNAKVLKTDPQQLATYTAMSGTALTSSGVNVISPFHESGGDDEGLIVAMPAIVVYQSDYLVEMLA